MDERRRFERVNIPENANVYATDRKGKKIGLVRVIGRGGMLIDTKNRFKTGDKLALMIVDETESIRRQVSTSVRYTAPIGVGFQFDELEPDAAVEVGVIIGKYYPKTRSEKRS